MAFAGESKVPWKEWHVYWLAEGLASGGLQGLKVEREEDEEAA